MPHTITQSGDGKIQLDDPDTPNNESELLQENHYYPFGMVMEGEWTPQIGERNQYQYNGKELNEDLGLGWNDYGARWYDAEIGRWNAVDPLASDFAAWSSYSYTFNNPIRFIDPDGRAPTPPNDYFDKNGNYLGSDKRGNDIRIVSDASSFNPNSSNAVKNSLYFNEVSLSEEAVGNIGRHYLDNSLGREDVSVRGLENAPFPFMAVTQGDGSPEKVVDGHAFFEDPTVSISMSGYGNVAGNLTDINNFVNILSHEVNHLNPLEAMVNGNWFKDVTPYSGDLEPMNHLFIFAMQVGHPSWEGTTDTHKSNTWKLIRGELGKIQDSGLRTSMNDYLNSLKDE